MQHNTTQKLPESLQWGVGKASIHTRRGWGHSKSHSHCRRQIFLVCPTLNSPDSKYIYIQPGPSIVDKPRWRRRRMRCRRTALLRLSIWCEDGWERMDEKGVGEAGWRKIVGEEVLLRLVAISYGLKNSKRGIGYSVFLSTDKSKIGCNKFRLDVFGHV